MTVLDFKVYSEQYVPYSGYAETVGGELIRAINQIFAVFEDEDERLGCSDYAEAAVNPAGRYIYRMVEDETVRAALDKCWGKDAYSRLVPYSQRIGRLFREMWSWVSDHPEVFQKENTVSFEDEIECPLDAKNAEGFDFSREFGASLNKAAGRGKRRK